MLTDTKIKALKPREKPFKVSDSGGLFILVNPNGSKYWRMKYRWLGKEKLLAVGVYPKVSLANARKVRDEAKEQLANSIDPSLYRQHQKAKRELEAENSFAAIAREWHERQSTTWAAITARRIWAILENDILPYLGKRPIAELQTFELVGCLNRIVDRGALETAHKARQVMNQVCRFAKQTGRLEHNPASDLVGAIPPQKVSHMAAITTPAEFGRLLVDIERYQGTHIIRTALALAPLLFQRPGELCGMEWSEIDLEQGFWTIPREKKKERNQTEGDHIVPLCKQAQALLRDIQPLTGHGKYVFPNQRNHEKAITREALNKALRNLGYDTRHQQCAHGFRASARTMLDEQLGLRIEWIEHQLAHKVKDALGNAYNRTKHLPERIDMMQRWADYLDSLKRQTVAGNVVSGEFRSSVSA
ncbi:tyrosine-type recombinase/integrase [Bacterioplanoides sp.]|uniref:tyrosine-type recombinase/integrase n=1 Tax=Bacterioplanoides sp. TaxID=2066072 RepID=UPI003B5CF33F